MLPRNSRLSVEKFPRKSKMAFKGPHFTFKTTPGDGRVAVLVSKANAKKAFLRNSIRRYIYNFFRENRVSETVNLLVMLNTSIMKLDLEKKEILEKELKTGINNINK